MISKAIFLDVLAVYLFFLYISNGRQPRPVQTRKLHFNRMDLFLSALSDLPLLISLVYIFTPWLDFADYRLPLWFSVTGVLLFIVALLLIGKAHSTIGHNFSPRMEIGDKQTLVSDGVYHYIRHPIYADSGYGALPNPCYCTTGLQALLCSRLLSLSIGCGCRVRNKCCLRISEKLIEIICSKPGEFFHA